MRRLRRSVQLEHALKSALWLALYAQWTTIVPIVVPDQLTRVVGQSATNREFILGTVLAMGAAVALVVAPIAGALSDLTMRNGGRRSWYLATGTIGGCVTLAIFGSLGPGSNISTYALLFMAMQFWWNWTAGPYAALIPDTVASSEIHMASAWLSALGVVGNITGNAMIFLFYTHDNPMIAILSLIALNVLGLLLTLCGLPASIKPKSSSRLLRVGVMNNIFPSPSAHPNFYRVLIGRLCCNMGAWSVFSFLLYYLQDVIQAKQPDKLLSSILAAGAAIAVPAAFGGGWLSKKFGYVGVARGASWVMAVSAVSLVIVAVYPSTAYVIPAIIVFSAAYGAYLAVDWALALSVLPDAESAGKDMGVWHVSIVLPQIVGPISIGFLIGIVAEAISKREAYIFAFGIAAFWFILSAASIKNMVIRTDGALQRSA